MGDGPARRLQRWRWLTRSAFFALFVLAPPLDLLRFDLPSARLVVLGSHWSLGIDGLVHGTSDAADVAWSIALRGLLPLLLVAAALLGVAWRYGRLYCGWLCPHYSAVEGINALMRRARGAPTLWEPGGGLAPALGWGALTVLAAAGCAALWAVALLTYLLPPAEVYAHLAERSLSTNEARFLGVAALVFLADFVLARHLFCKYGCAVGFFQSYAWMANRRAMVVGYDRTRSAACAGCNNDCDRACPMRLRPRATKRQMFSCTQCARCLQACASRQQGCPEGPLLRWVQRGCAQDAAWPGLGEPRVRCVEPDCHLQHREREGRDGGRAGR